MKESLLLQPDISTLPASEAFLHAPTTALQVRSYINIMRMAQDESRPEERRFALKNTALHMLFNTTAIEGVSFMGAEQHRRFMTDLTTYGLLNLKEVKEGENHG